MNFITFKQAVAKQFDMMAKHDLFTTKVEKDDLWTTYLGSFPEGSNPIYKTRISENDAAATARANREKKQQIMALIDQKQNEALGALSVEDLRKMVESL